MRCFTHHEVEAVAICRACFKGVCPSCAMPVGESVACSCACASNAARLLRVVTVSSENAGAVQRTQGTLFLVLAAGCGIGALIATDIGRWVMSIVAALFVLGAVRYFRLSRHWREIDRP